MRADRKPRPDSSASGVSVWCGSGQGTGSQEVGEVSIKSLGGYLRGDNRYVKGISEIAESHAQHLGSQECDGYLLPEHIITGMMTDRVYRGEPHQSSSTRGGLPDCWWKHSART